MLTREPLKSIFHVLAWDAKTAMFTSGSQSIVYSIGGFGESPRVEKWNIASHQRTEVHEIHVGKGCLNPSLSPDGKNLACIIDPGSTDTFRLDLVVYDTATGTEVWRHNNWWSPGIMTGGYLESLNLIFGLEKSWEHELPIRFSPDGRYLVAHALLNSVGVDLASRSTIPLSNGIKNLMEQNVFTFLGNDRFIGLKDGYSGNARILKFPPGETVADDLHIGNATPSSVVRGNYIVLRPLKKNPVGLMDVTRKEIVVASRNTASMSGITAASPSSSMERLPISISPLTRQSNRRSCRRPLWPVLPRVGLLPTSSGWRCRNAPGAAFGISRPVNWSTG